LIRILFDTSVLVPAMIGAHPMHARALPWLRRARDREFAFFVSAHALAETYAVLTALPLSPRATPGGVSMAIHNSIFTRAEIVTFTKADYELAIRDVAALGFKGGMIFDALHVRAAQKAKVDSLLTFNVAHFQLLWPAGEAKIISP
jgi:predicted nucleic acid-binding protein